MDIDRPIPDAVNQVLARFGARIEYTDFEPDGIVNLAKSEVANDDLGQLVFYPGFASLNLDNTRISDAGLIEVGKMSGLVSLRLSDTLISNDGLNPTYSYKNIGNRKTSRDPACFME